MKAIMSRRSIRKYLDQSISEEIITNLLKAAMAAPSAGNQQPWHYIILDDREILQQIPEIHPHAKMVMEAPISILVCGDLTLEKYKGFWVQDCSAAVENILIAVEEQGLGAVWCGVYPMEERVVAFRKLLNIPEHVIPMALIPIGYPAEEKEPADRYDLSKIHKNSW